MNDVRVYELPRHEYALVQEVRREVGRMAEIVIKCFLAKQIQSMEQHIPPEQEKRIREIAKQHGIILPVRHQLQPK